MKKSFQIIFVFLVLISCHNNRQSNIEKSIQATRTDTTKKRTIETLSIKNSKNELPNDDFRKEVLPKITGKQDVRRLNTILSILDKNNITFCKFVQRLAQLDDSCYALAGKKYPDPFQQSEFAKFHNKAIKHAEEKYLESLKLQRDDALFASIVSNFNDDVKKYCESF